MASDRVSLDTSDEELQRRYAEVRALGERLLGDGRLSHEERARLAEVRDAARVLAGALILLPARAAADLAAVHHRLPRPGDIPRDEVLRILQAATELVGEGNVG